MGGLSERAQRILDKVVRTTYHERAHTGETVINTYQDCQKQVDHAAKARAHERDTRGHFGKRSNFRRTMVVPFNVIQQIVTQKFGLPAAAAFDPNVAEKLWKELHSSEYKLLRTTNDKRIG